MLTADEITDWKQDHMDALVTRAVRAEMHRDELLRVVREELSRAPSPKRSRLLAVVVRIEGEKNARP
jgi:hypothetical protein